MVAVGVEGGGGEGGEKRERRLYLQNYSYAAEATHNFPP